MKKKIGNCIFKKRAAAALAKMQPLLDPDNYRPQAIFNGQAIFEGVDEILYIARHFQVIPAVGITYRRRALMGKNDPRLRITFDERISASEPDIGMTIPENPKMLFEPHLVVLEIKANNFLPLWLVRIIEKHNLKLQSISKYCHGIMAQNVNLRDMRY